MKPYEYYATKFRGIPQPKRTAHITVSTKDTGDIVVRSRPMTEVEVKEWVSHGYCVFYEWVADEPLAEIEYIKQARALSRKQIDDLYEETGLVGHPLAYEYVSLFHTNSKAILIRRNIWDQIKTLRQHIKWFEDMMDFSNPHDVEKFKTFMKTQASQL